MFPVSVEILGLEEIEPVDARFSVCAKLAVTAWLKRTCCSSILLFRLRRPFSGRSLRVSLVYRIPLIDPFSLLDPWLRG